MTKLANCNFSFSGIKEQTRQHIIKEEQRQGLSEGDILPNVKDICASFQYSVLLHMAKRVQRAFLFCDLHGLLPAENRTLVISGGVGSNQFIRNGLRKVCDKYQSRLVCPPPKLCTDNGIMIAWNGVEKLRLGIEISGDPESEDVMPKCRIGEDITDQVEKNTIKLDRIKLL